MQRFNPGLDDFFVRRDDGIGYVLYRFRCAPKAYRALRPGGELHVVGETLDDEKRGPLGPALWGLHEALFGSAGRAHSEGEVRGYLERAGFAEVRVHPFVPGSLTRITGNKQRG